MTDTATPQPPPTPMPKAVLCPYCGSITKHAQRCESCKGHLDALSRQATQNGMGPWQLHDSSRPFHPGCSYEVVFKLIQAGRIQADTIMRGPTTGQFWMLARRTPGVSHLLGWCHSCQAPAQTDDYACRSCGAVFQGDRDRQHLGLGPIRPLPGEGSDEMVAARASFAMPEAPVPTPGAGLSRTPTATVQTHNGNMDATRVRSYERRIEQLRAKLGVAIGVSIVLGCACVAAVLIMALNTPQPTPLTNEPLQIDDPIYTGPGLVPLDDDSSHPVQQDDQAETEGKSTDDSEQEQIDDESEVEQIPDRPFDITLLAWPDAKLHLESVVDISSADSIKNGIALLSQYDQAVGLPEGGQELLEAWTYRLEQLRLNGLP